MSIWIENWRNIARNNCLLVSKLPKLEVTDSMKICHYVDYFYERQFKDLQTALMTVLNHILIAFVYILKACFTLRHFSHSKLKHVTTISWTADWYAIWWGLWTHATTSVEIYFYKNGWHTFSKAHCLSCYYDIIPIYCCRGLLICYKPQLIYWWPLYTSLMIPKIF
jgi:hypothetical protein